MLGVIDGYGVLVCAGVGEKLTGDQSLVDRWRSSVAATHARSAAKRFRRTYGIHKRGERGRRFRIFSHTILVGSAYDLYIFEFCVVHAPQPRGAVSHVYAIYTCCV